jgi:hypothetical protein
MNDILDQVLIMLKSAVGSKFAVVEYGRRDVVDIGRSELPHLCVFASSSDEDISGTGNDNAEYVVGIRAIVSASDKPNQPRTARIWGERELIDAFEGRETSGKARPDTVKGVLFNDVTLGDKVLRFGRVRVSYDQGALSDNKPAVAAEMRFTAMTRPPRK